MTVNVLIADDHTLLCAALRIALAREADLNMVGETNCTKEGLLIARDLQPDVLLMNVNHHVEDVPALVRCLASECPTVRVVLLTEQGQQTLVREAVEAGAAGLVAKHATLPDLIGAVRATARGDLYIHPSLTRAFLNAGATANSSTGPGLLLTPRETDVLRLLAQGYTNRQVADRLCLSVRTVETHRARLRVKLGADSRAELMHHAAQRGLL